MSIDITITDNQPGMDVTINEEVVVREVGGGGGSTGGVLPVVIDESNKSRIPANATLEGKTIDYIIVKLGALFPVDDFVFNPADGSISFTYDRNVGDKILIPWR